MATQSQQNSLTSEKRVSQWEALMRKFSEAHKEECKNVSLDIPRVPRSIKQFPTGSQYEGTWDVLGMSGYGTYIFSNDVVYEGEFHDGMFHGSGELRYPSGAILKGKWKSGVLTERTLVFADGLEYSETDWKYCKMPDRRFTIEYEKGIQPGGQSFLTAEQATREIPTGFYDTGDGFFDPKTKVVYKADDLTAIIRSPSVCEQKWIIENCRTSPEKELGPRPDLYEQWLRPHLDPERHPKQTVITRTQPFKPTPRVMRGSELVRITFWDVLESQNDKSERFELQPSELGHSEWELPSSERSESENTKSRSNFVTFPFPTVAYKDDDEDCYDYEFQKEMSKWPSTISVNINKRPVLFYEAKPSF